MNINIVTKDSKFSMDVGSQEPILEIKKRIQKILGIPISSQTLSAYDWELIDDLDLSYYPISDGTPIHLSTTQLRVTIKFSSREIELDVNKTDTLLSLKEKIHIVDGTSIKRMTLFFDGKEMLDDYQDLNDYGLQEGSEIMVSSKPLSQLAAATRRLEVVVEKVGGMRFPVEMSETSRVDEMRNMMVEKGMLPEDDYIFVHKQRLMEADCSLRWHGVENRDFIYVFKGTVSEGKSDYKW
ncbi:hypothetical protein CASFOL_031346 [Castilleja foliolosa]|uniref:Ubiquitin-like domain-containing protein n=1 Tax=Castilleja foliolosa TaxID=1961234 RepID=A0ABD3C5B5_9LAMI